MANTMMLMPDTLEEFMEQNKVVDTEQIYTNGTELVPIFRIKQWFISHSCDIPRWIPVTERLPEAYGRYLVTLEHEDYIRVMPLYYGRINRKDTFYDSANEYGDIKCRRVIAWMPFPEPYKGGDETKHGEWKIDGFEDLDDGTSQMIVRCSVCGNTQGVLTNYCPNCGSSMMDEVEE